MQENVFNTIDTLIIIGNGFDIWQELDTGYLNFKKYYLNHRDRILNSLGISKITVEDSWGKREITPVEIVYGESFELDEMPDTFWKTFEASLSKIDSQRLNLIFDKDDEGLEWLGECVHHAKLILSVAFNEWIQTLHVEDNEEFQKFLKKHALENFQFGSNCYFINFNYTRTLEERFGLEEDAVFHIHGQCGDEDELIFGHAEHPQEPEHHLHDLGGRFLGLYNVESVLYETDKHVQNIIEELAFVLSCSGIMAQNIKNVFVLGHSLGMADLEYFDYLVDMTTADRGDMYKEFFKDRVYFDRNDWDFEKAERLLSKGDSLEDVHNRMSYVVKRYGYRVTDEGYQDYGYCYEEEILPEELAAINKKYGIEQSVGNMELEEQFFGIMEEELGGLFGAEDIIAPDQAQECGYGAGEPAELKACRRKEDAMWHISCFSDADKEWAGKVMDGLGCKNFKLYESIDECLEVLKQSEK